MNTCFSSSLVLASYELPQGPFFSNASGWLSVAIFGACLLQTGKIPSPLCKALPYPRMGRSWPILIQAIALGWFFTLLPRHPGLGSFPRMPLLRAQMLEKASLWMRLGKGIELLIISPFWGSEAERRLILQVNELNRGFSLHVAGLNVRRDRIGVQSILYRWDYW